MNVIQAIKDLLLRRVKSWQPQMPPQPSPIAPAYRAKKLEEEAARWVIRLDAASCTPEDREAFTAWRLSSPRNAAAHIRIREAWQRANVVRRRRPLDGQVDPDVLSSFAPAQER